MAFDSVPPEWQEPIDAILGSRGVVLVLGAIDTGKTTFVLTLTNAAIEHGVPTAVVDADIGQSEIGPPTCVSMGLPAAPVTALGEIRPVSMGFVGSITPAMCPLEHVSQTVRMVQEARLRGAELIVCDTTGLAAAPWALRLKRAKIEALCPNHLVYLASSSASSPFLDYLRGLEAPRLYRAPVPQEVVPKTPALRAQRREWKLAQVFQNARPVQWNLEELVFDNSWLGSGEPLAPAALRQLEGLLRLRLSYGEVSEHTLGLVAYAPPNVQDPAQVIAPLYGKRALQILQNETLQGLLVGLFDGERALLGLGRVAGLDPETRRIRVHGSAPAPKAVRRIRLGFARFDRNGHLISYVRAGEY